MGLYDDLFKKVRDHMKWDDEKTKLWFRTPNPNLGGVSPKHMFFVGRAAKLEKWIYAAIEESSPEMPMTQKAENLDISQPNNENDPGRSLVKK